MEQAGIYFSVEYYNRYYTETTDRLIDECAVNIKFCTLATVYTKYSIQNARFYVDALTTEMGSCWSGVVECWRLQIQ